MSRNNTRHGAYDVSLEIEIKRVLLGLKEIGIRNPTILETTALIAEKNKRAKMSIPEVRNFFIHLRGLND